MQSMGGASGTWPPKCSATASSGSQRSGRNGDLPIARGGTSVLLAAKMPAMPRAAIDTPVSLSPLLTPHGCLLLAADADAQPLPEAIAQRLADAFARRAGHGQLQLGAAEVGGALPPALAWWRDFAARYVTSLCATSGLSSASPGKLPHLPMTNSTHIPSRPTIGSGWGNNRISTN